MATLLYRLGRFSFRRRGLVAVVWVALLVGAGIGAATLSSLGSGPGSGTETPRFRRPTNKASPTRPRVAKGHHAVAAPSFSRRLRRSSAAA